MLPIHHAASRTRVGEVPVRPSRGVVDDGPHLGAQRDTRKNTDNAIAAMTPTPMSTRSSLLTWTPLTVKAASLPRNLWKTKDSGPKMSWTPASTATITPTVATIR